MPRIDPGIDEMIEKTPGWRGAMLARIREIVLAAGPEMTETVKRRRAASPLGAAVWEHAGMVCLGGVLKERVRLTMAWGAKLPAPKRLYNAMLIGNKARAIDFAEGDKPDAVALKALVRAGAAFNLARSTPSRGRNRKARP